MTLKIRHKLFFAILIANIILAVSIYFLSNWSFSKSFKDYLDSTQAERLAPLVTAIADTYQQEQGWDWVKSRQNRMWPKLMREHFLKLPPPPRFGPPPHHFGPRPQANSSEKNNSDWQRQRFAQPPPYPPPHQLSHESLMGHRPPGPQHWPPPGPPPGPHSGPPPGRPPVTDPLEINNDILLADANHQLIIGRADKQQEAYWIPVIVDESEVGYLGFFRTTKFTGELDQLFVKQLQTNFSWIVLGMIFVSVLLTLPLARQIVRPIEKLRRATHKVSSGRYETRIQNNSQDEIGELSRDFNLLAETLEKNLAARQQWIADISHELRTPVAILQGELEALQDGVRSLSEATVNSLHQEVIRLGRLINDLHQLSLSDLGALSYKKETLNLIDIIDDVIDNKSDALEEKNIKYINNYTSKYIAIAGDYHRLTQLFYNLLNNSLAYTDDSGCIEVNVSTTKSHVMVIWSDTEPGVSDTDLERLFDRLYRADDSRNRNTGGSGLGLSITKNIVEAHQGTIVASHSKSGGVCITITLPLIKINSGR